VWSVGLGSAEEFTLCCRFTLVFARAKIRTCNAFLRLRRGRKKTDRGRKKGEEEREYKTWNFQNKKKRKQQQQNASVWL